MSTLPAGWRTEPFRTLLADGVRNGMYKPKEFHGRGAKIVNMGELFAHPRLRAVPMKRIDADESELRRFSLMKNDLLFARRSLVAEGAGKCSVVLDVNEATVFESSIIRARVCPEKAEALYLYYLWSSPLGGQLLGSILRQVAVSGITGKDLEQLEIPVPPLPEQRAIAGVLGALDDKIELNRRTSRTLEKLARAIFRAWFVDFEPVKAKAAGARSFPSMPQQAFDALPTRLVPSELGPIPEGWEMGTLASVCEIVGGGTPKRSDASYWGGDIPWYSVRDVPADADMWVTRTAEMITRRGLEKSSACIIPMGGTIISARGTVGKLALAAQPMAFNQSCYGLLPREGHGPYFLHLVIQQAVRELQQRTHGSVFDTITRETFERVQIVEPDEITENVFEDVVGPLLNSILQRVRESGKLATLRDYLLPKLLSGEVRVSEAAQMLKETI